jgi:hypothetical protein
MAEERTIASARHLLRAVREADDDLRLIEDGLDAVRRDIVEAVRATRRQRRQAALVAQSLEAALGDDAEEPRKPFPADYIAQKEGDPPRRGRVNDYGRARMKIAKRQGMGR